MRDFGNYPSVGWDAPPTSRKTMDEKQDNNNSVTAQFQDGIKKKIITGRIIEDLDSHITIECEHARYRLNKNNVEWIKYER